MKTVLTGLKWVSTRIVGALLFLLIIILLSATLQGCSYSIDRITLRACDFMCRANGGIKEVDTSPFSPTTCVCGNGAKFKYGDLRPIIDEIILQEAPAK